MFGHRYFGARMFGPRYFGSAGTAVVTPTSTVRSAPPTGKRKAQRTRDGSTYVQRSSR